MNFKNITGFFMITIHETADGSQTLKNELIGESYHSSHGALQESMHVYIQHGLRQSSIKNNKIRVFELGFGSGLNALLTLRETLLNKDLEIEYVCVEPFPIHEKIVQQLTYPNPNERDGFILMHQVESGTWLKLHDRFSFLKLEDTFENYRDDTGFELVYYDAFGPTTQPELWNMDALKRSVDLMNSGGVWVTYCSKGEVRRGLNSLGMNAVRLAGPPGKRHMIFATKP